MAGKTFNARLDEKAMARFERKARKLGVSKTALLRQWIAGRSGADDIEEILHDLRSDPPDVDIDLLVRRQKNPPRSKRPRRAV